jgi:DNA polymerase Ligase (LigD)
MNRFVILRHVFPPDAGRADHWDFMLEAGEVLWTWALVQSPDAEGPQAAERLADHRPFYLDYEGPISGDRGSVTRWDAGTYIREIAEPDRVVVKLAGRQIAGRASLTRRTADSKVWEYRWEGTVAK